MRKDISAALQSIRWKEDTSRLLNITGSVRDTSIMESQRERQFRRVRRRITLLTRWMEDDSPRRQPLLATTGHTRMSFVD